MRSALFPFRQPMKPGKPILGGMPAVMCTWSGIRCPSIISTPFHWQRFLRISPRSFRYWL